MVSWGVLGMNENSVFCSFQRILRARGWTKRLPKARASCSSPFCVARTEYRGSLQDTSWLFEEHFATQCTLDTCSHRGDTPREKQTVTKDSYKPLKAHVLETLQQKGVQKYKGIATLAREIWEGFSCGRAVWQPQIGVSWWKVENIPEGEEEHILGSHGQRHCGLLKDEKTSQAGHVVCRTNHGLWAVLECCSLS